MSTAQAGTGRVKKLRRFGGEDETGAQLKGARQECLYRALSQAT